jgi:uncharacterized protein
VDPLEIIDRHYQGHGKARRLLLAHSALVARKALEAARIAMGRQPGLVLDLGFIEEAAMLHDIGMICTDAPALGCRGELPYICHGVLGREMLEAEGLPRHALVCERHVGVGITAREIEAKGLPLPSRDMVPLSPEEQAICFADKFFSKNGGDDGPPEEKLEKPLALVRQSIARYGEDKLRVFDGWLKRFSLS